MTVMKSTNRSDVSIACLKKFRLGKPLTEQLVDAGAVEALTGRILQGVAVNQARVDSQESSPPPQESSPSLPPAAVGL